MDNLTYETSDLRIATAILAADSKLFLSMEGHRPRCTFIFKDLKACKELQTKFLQGDLMVDAKKLLDAGKELKALLYAEAGSASSLQEIRVERSDDL